jgi:hypothetical protein
VTEIASIKGGADATMAAAISAAVAHNEQSEAETRAIRPPVPKPSPWVQSSRPRDIPPPLISHQFDAAPWTEAGEAVE